MTDLEVNQMVEKLLIEKFSKPMKILELRLEGLTASLRKMKHNSLAIELKRPDCYWKD